MACISSRAATSWSPKHSCRRFWRCCRSDDDRVGGRADAGVAVALARAVAARRRAARRPRSKRDRRPRRSGAHLAPPKFLARRLVHGRDRGASGDQDCRCRACSRSRACAESFRRRPPYATEVLTIPIDEPRGVLRSWDLRADWRADAPACTAIVDRPYPEASAFPAWFVNITDFATGRPRASDFGRRAGTRASTNAGCLSSRSTAT